MTDYQLLNIIKFVYFNAENSKKNSDLYISTAIKNFREKADILIDMGIFSHVYIVENVEYSANRAARKIDAFFKCLDKKSFLKLMHSSDRPDLGTKYETLMIPCINLMCDMFCHYFLHSHVYLIEDGAGSYSGNIAASTTSKSRQMFHRITGTDYIIQKLYVNQKEICRSTVSDSIEQIPYEDNLEYLDFLKKIFLPLGYKSCYKDGAFVYLQQPLQDFGNEFLNMEKEILLFLIQAEPENFIFREHPRCVNQLKRYPCKYDDSGAAWECICIDDISEESVLIGMSSTALITPKLLFGKEPYLVFLYKLYPHNQEYINICDDIAKNICSIYEKPEKVFCPDSITELKKYFLSARGDSFER